ncbi:MAG: cyclic nucleotide-binding domain-containing protein [Pseudobdellovibrionaceae bacterium]
MSLHPAEIAQEIRKYHFFSSFDESLLLQVSTMVREVDFKAGQILLKAEQMNDKLYFLREGIVEILVDDEKVNELLKEGEVIGEMSVLSGKPVSAQIRAQTPVRCFYISAEDFAHVNPSQKDRFQFLLYKIYSGVLTDRLMKTNEKAKLYEITARELRIKKKELEIVSSAQMNFLRIEAATENQERVLLLEPTKKQQNILKTAVGGAGVPLDIASNLDEAKGLYQEHVPAIIFCDDTMSEFLAWVNAQGYKGHFVMMESLTINFQRLMDLNFIRNVITRDPEDRTGTVKSILTSLSKILHKNYFGVEKYLSWGTDVKTVKVAKSKDRGQLKEGMLTHFKSLGIRGAILDRVQVAAEEMLMNAIYDAPVDIEGKSLFNHLPRTTEVELNPNQQSELSFGCDGNLLAVSILDPFGALRQDILIRYLDSCYNGAAGTLNANKGGAGRGLHQILESCDWTIFNVEAGSRTEVIALFDIDQKRDGPPQFHYFFLK